MTDTITQEIRDIRHRLAKKFDNDLARIVDDLKARQENSGHTLIDRSVAVKCLDNKALNRSGDQRGNQMDNQSSSPG